MSAIFLFLVYFIFSVGGLTLFKVGTHAAPIGWIEHLCGLKLSLLSIGGLICYGVSFLTYLILISKSELSLVYPVATGVSCILILLVSTIILRENVHPLNWVGAAIIIIGMILVNYGRH